MKLNNQQIEQAVAKSDCRFYLEHVYLDLSDDPQLVATDGIILAVVPVDADGDHEGYISPEALKAGRKAGSLAANGSLDAGGTSFTRPLTTDDGKPDAKYPDYRRVIPKDVKTAPDICLDAECIIRLARALSDVKGNKQKLLNFHFQLNPDGAVDGTQSVYITPVTGTGFGVIMPCRIK